MKLTKQQKDIVRATRLPDFILMLVEIILAIIALTRWWLYLKRRKGFSSFFLRANTKPSRMREERVNLS